MADVEDVIFGSDLLAEPRSVVYSLRERLLSQGQRIENLNSEPLKDSALPKFPPTKE